MTQFKTKVPEWRCFVVCCWPLSGCQGCHSDDAFFNKPESKVWAKNLSLWQLYLTTLATQKLSIGCHRDCAQFKMVPNLGYLGNNFLVVNADNFDNFLGDNHKVVLLTTILTTRWQPCILCEEGWWSRLCMLFASSTFWLLVLMPETVGKIKEVWNLIIRQLVEIFRALIFEVNLPPGR